MIVEDGMLKATNNFSFVRDVDFIAICVLAPLDSHQPPDTSCVRASAEEIAKYMINRTMDVLESTTYPGTTEEVLMPLSYLSEISLSNERAFFSNKIYAKISITTGACIILDKMIGTFVDNSIGVVIAFLIIELLLAICCIRYEISKYYRIKTKNKCIWNSVYV